MRVEVHETALVDAGAQIGDGTRVWHWTHVCAGARIGENCSLGQNVFIGNRVTIGNGCKIQNNVSIYDNIVLEDQVFCGPSMVFTNVINPRAEFVRKTEYRETRVGKGSTIGANATVVCGVTLGRYCFVAAGSVVTKDVPDYALIAGVPGRQIGWMSRFGERIPLPLSGEAEYVCPSLGETYVLNGMVMTIKAGQESK
ncbi:MAG: N-acetyltransferase [Bdellovibrionaceae bacterium]|nr:N-acetyltransferase [Pseudobdellovibrionaceae bacterium]